MNDTKEYFFTEINHLDEMTEVDLIEQSLQEQEQRERKCDMCGHIIGAGCPVYDENWNKQSGLVQCKYCQANSLKPYEKRKKLPF
jgi:hypothetical protein